MTPTNEEIEALKAKAEAATPGPWYVEAGDGNEMRFLYIRSSAISTIVFTDDFLEVDGWSTDQKDLNFIAAANPATILSLIASLKQAKTERDEARKVAIDALLPFAALLDGFKEWRHGQHGLLQEAHPRHIPVLTVRWPASEHAYHVRKLHTSDFEKAVSAISTIKREVKP